MRLTVGPLAVPRLAAWRCRWPPSSAAARRRSVTVRGNSSTDGNVTASGTILFNAAPTCNLDIDGDGAVLATTDGLLILRNLLQLTGTALVSGAYNRQSSRQPA